MSELYYTYYQDRKVSYNQMLQNNIDIKNIDTKLHFIHSQA